VEGKMNKLLIVGALLAMTGCNTTQGLGKDLQEVGGVITGTAQGVQRGATSSNQTPPPMGQTTPTNCQPDANGLVLEGCPKPQ
jgi:predicted small secreted protein